MQCGMVALCLRAPPSPSRGGQSTDVKGSLWGFVMQVKWAEISEDIANKMYFV
jgi:hypothetical protein